MSGIIDPRERERAHANTGHVDFYAEAVKASAQFRKDYDERLNLVKAHQMPFERSPDGLISISSTRRWIPRSAAWTSTCSSCRPGMPPASIATSPRRSST